MAGTVRIEGLDALLKKLSGMGGNCDKALVKGTQKATQRVEGSAKRLSPVRGGFLRESISRSTKQTANGAEGEVFTNAEYAAYMEFGTGLRGEASPSPPKAPLPLRYTLEKPHKGGGNYAYKGVPAQPYLYPALMENKDLIQNDYLEAVRKMIQERSE